MLLMIQKEISGGICHTIHRYSKANKKYVKECDKNKESSYLEYWDVSNLYGSKMSQTFPVNNFEWIADNFQFIEGFIKNANEESDEEYFLKDDVQYTEKLHELHNDLPFLPERMRVKKVEKLAANLHDKAEYVVHIWNLKQALNHGLIFKKIHRAIKFNQKAWRKPYIDMNTELRQNAKNNSDKYFFKLMNNSVFP